MFSCQDLWHQTQLLIRFPAGTVLTPVRDLAPESDNQQRKPNGHRKNFPTEKKYTKTPAHQVEMASIELEKLGEEPPPSRSSSTSTMAGGCLCFRRQWAKLVRNPRSLDHQPTPTSCTPVAPPPKAEGHARLAVSWVCSRPAGFDPVAAQPVLGAMGKEGATFWIRSFLLHPTLCFLCVLHHLLSRSCLFC